ncbi:hypothetical protein [Opitutus sp. ER46]|uniref:hypothetical protein n=1 Tax=Opitutus sp. ER46 TaxID=2161864 RepID=UPI000D31DCF1|nr:hypothetical protein [Opitutus sp. ER46]PTX97707.1 hypothetical protein DB354_05345 [Opitutus sp. ER46]
MTASPSTPPSPSPAPAADAELARRRIRQRRTLIVLSFVLIAAGIVVLTALPRLPLPMRILTGLGDIFLGMILLVVVRQHH